MQNTVCPSNRAEILKLLCHVGTLVRCPPRAELCRQGDPPEHVFFVEEGLVTLSALNANGREYHLSLRSPGSILGASSVIMHEAHLAYMTARIPSKVRFISAEDFMIHLRKDSNLSQYVLELQAGEISEQYWKVSGLALYSARQRLEEFLWSSLPSLPMVKGRIQLPFSDIEITRFISTTPQYLSSIFKELQEEGLIRRSGGWLVVPDRDRLWHREGMGILPISAYSSSFSSSTGAAC